MNNQEIFKYCPRCSGDVRLEDMRKIVCAVCGFELYLNTAAAVAGLVFDDDGRLLWIRRNREPQSGLLDLPGGFVDFGEDAESALRREILEELGFEVKKAEYLRSIPNVYDYGGVVYNTLDLFFTCKQPVHTRIRPNDEVMEIVYIHSKDIDKDEVAFDSIKKLIMETCIN